MPKEKLSRAQLYTLVWSEPMRKLALRIHVSDVAVAKRCRRLEIPVPGRGYWARKAAGQRVRVPALPPLRPGVMDAPIEFVERVPTETSPVEHAPDAVEGPVWEAEQFESRPENNVLVPETLDRVRGAVRRTRAALRRYHPVGGDQSVAIAQGDGCLDVRVSHPQCERAMRIMQAFLDACAARGYHWRPFGEQQRHDGVVVLDQAIRVRLSERQRREKRQPEKPPRRGQPAVLPYPRYEYFATGELELLIGDANAQGFRFRWSDSKHRRLEECLNEVMVGLVQASVAAKREAEEAAERRRQCALEEQERHRRAMERYREERRVEQLEAQAGAWERAQRLRAFAGAVEREAADRKPAEESGPELREWLTWVRAVADRWDPLAVAQLVEFLTRQKRVY
jgi:hypothetical protein